MGNPWKDHVGSTFGDLTVVALLTKTKKTSKWKCLCKCGLYHTVSSKNLVGGQVTRCFECYIQSRRKIPEDLTGRRFGGFVVQKYAGRERTKGEHIWFCLCDCGRTATVKDRRLHNNVATRCTKCATTKHDRSKSNEYFLFVDAKSRAKKYGMEFTLELDDIVVPELCPCLGIPIQRKIERPGNLSKEDRDSGIKYRLNDNSASLDRIDSSKDYIKGNVWVISARANRIKNNSTPDELVKIARAVRRRQAE